MAKKIIIEKPEQPTPEELEKVQEWSCYVVAMQEKIDAEKHTVDDHDSALLDAVGWDFTSNKIPNPDRTKYKMKMHRIDIGSSWTYQLVVVYSVFEGDFLVDYFEVDAEDEEINTMTSDQFLEHVKGSRKDIVEQKKELDKADKRIVKQFQSIGLTKGQHKKAGIPWGGDA